MKNIFLALSLFLTIIAPMFAWGIFNQMGIPDDASIWNVVVIFVAMGLFIFVPLTCGHLLHTKYYVPPKKLKN